MQPGEVIGPGGNSPEEPEKPAETPPEQPAESVESSEDNDSSVAQPSTSDEASTAEAPKSEWQYVDGESEVAKPTLVAHDPVSWTASEYIAHEKGTSWYMMLGIAVVIFATLVFFLTDEWISSIVIVIMGAAFGAFAARQPQELDYRLDNTALHVGGKSYAYAQFKSFTIVEEGPIHSIMLMPLQRFMPPLSVYYSPEDEDKITEALQSYLPYEDRKQDAVDRFMSKIRF